MMRGHVTHFGRRYPVQAPDGSPRRFLPAPGQQLTLANIRGPWRPSGAVAGMGVFAVVWDTGRGSFWAPLHDFAAADQLRLVEDCRRLTLEADGPGDPMERWR